METSERSRSPLFGGFEMPQQPEPETPPQHETILAAVKAIESDSELELATEEEDIDEDEFLLESLEGEAPDLAPDPIPPGIYSLRPGSFADTLLETADGASWRCVLTSKILQEQDVLHETWLRKPIRDWEYTEGKCLVLIDGLTLLVSVDALTPKAAGPR